MSRSSARSSWIGAGPPPAAPRTPPPARSMRQGRGPAPTPEVRRDVREIRFVQCFAPLPHLKVVSWNVQKARPPGEPRALSSPGAGPSQVECRHGNGFYPWATTGMTGGGTGRTPPEGEWEEEEEEAMSLVL
ncbi:unnamed protein product [Prorocentrum cordatum]|uniref:Uncharacterized protein n=1 Tax=Prorocentrum cordatum TaxID=2364126 RepID=A0ABN9QUK6_9DINO|nr:unnamed protein product [Polarella glacialis]